MRCLLGFDTTEVEDQAEELSNLLAATFPEGVPENLLRRITELLLDFGLRDGDMTLRATDGGEFVIGIKFGGIYGEIVAALRAGKLSDVLHGYTLRIKPLVSQMSTSGK